MSACVLTLFGGFRLLGPDSSDLMLSTRKDRLLLAYLALLGAKPERRDRLAGLLWADRGETQAKDSLRQSIASIRLAFKRCGFDPVEANRASVALHVEGIEIDVLRFEALSHEPASWEEAAELYRGELLPEGEGISAEFDAWLLAERARLSAIALRLAEDISKRGKSQAGLQLANRLVHLDPIAEPAYRALMRLHAANGDGSEALKAYATCREALKHELDIAPDLATETLYRDIITERSAPLLSPSAIPGSAPGSERPSVAILPFDNLSGDPSLDPFCEGIAEDVITGLGQFRLLFVIDRYSSSAIAKQTNDVFEIGKRLGVFHLVQGSLQRSAERIRITVRLVDAQSRAQIWGETFDRDKAELVALPEAITRAIVGRLHHRLEQSLLDRSRRKPSLAAYECVLRGIKHLRGYAQDDNDRAIEYFQRAVDLDPDYALALAYRGFAEVVKYGYDLTPRDKLLHARNSVARAIQMDDQEARCHWLMGVIAGFMNDVKSESEHCRRALALNPNDANALASLGAATATLGEIDKGLDMIREAMRINPFHPEWYWIMLGNVLYQARRYDGALEAFRKRVEPGYWVLARIAACYGQLGRVSEAAVVVIEVLRLKPDFAISRLRRGGWSEEHAAHIREGLRKAGLPE